MREYGGLVEKHLAEADKHVAEAEKYQKLIDNLSSVLGAEQLHVPEVLQQEVETYPKHREYSKSDACCQGGRRDSLQMHSELGTHLQKALFGPFHGISL